MSTSALMMDCRGLIGTVKIQASGDVTENEEVFVFNNQGLLEGHSHSRSGRKDVYQYDFDTRNGFQLVTKTDNKGNVTRYTTKFDANGLIAELSANDGTRHVYSYNDKQLNKITYYNKSGVVKTDYYDDRLKLEKSVRNGVTIVYKYNSEGDVISMSKMKGSAVMESTTYEYEYDKNGLWIEMSQYNNGEYFTKKTRQFEKPTNIVRNNSVMPEQRVAPLPSQNEQVFETVEQMPQFPGGPNALFEYLAKSVKYPVVAEENGIQGRVIMTFVLERDGSITDVKVAKSVDPSLDKEAIRVIQSMPKWNPGKQNGSTVRVKYTVPVTFRLQ